MLIVPFWMDLCGSIFYLGAPLLMIDLGGNPVEMGLIGTITASVHMSLANAAGRLSDRFGRRLLLMTGPLIFSVSCLLMSQAGGVKTILLLAGLNGLGFALFWPSFQAWVADLQTGSALARNIGTFNLSWTASQLIGPILAGLLFAFHPRLPFLTAAGLSFFLFFFLRRSVHQRSPQKGKEEIAAPPDISDSGALRKFLYATWVANFASWFMMGNIRYQFPKLGSDLGLSPPMIGLILGCVGLAQFLGFFLLRETDRWHFRKVFLVGAQALATVGLGLIYLFSERILFAAAFLFIGLSVSVTYYSSLYYAVRLLKQKGKGTGLHESILGSGVVLGPLLGGLGAQSAGVRTPYILCLAVLLSAVGLELFFLRRKRAERLPLS